MDTICQNIQHTGMSRKYFKEQLNWKIRIKRSAMSYPLMAAARKAFKEKHFNYIST